MTLFACHGRNLTREKIRTRYLKLNPRTDRAKIRSMRVTNEMRHYIDMPHVMHSVAHPAWTGRHRKECIMIPHAIGRISFRHASCSSSKELRPICTVFTFSFLIGAVLIINHRFERIIFSHAVSKPLARPHTIKQIHPLCTRQEKTPSPVSGQGGFRKKLPAYFATRSSRSFDASVAGGTITGAGSRTGPFCGAIFART